jgi:hypothetical protein
LRSCANAGMSQKPHKSAFVEPPPTATSASSSGFTEPPPAAKP